MCAGLIKVYIGQALSPYCSASSLGGGRRVESS